MISDIRNKLRAAYTEFTELYGLMNKSRNRNIILKDNYGFVILSSVEVKVDGEYIPADVLTKSNKGEVEVFRTDNCPEALMYCLGILGKVDINKICEIVDKDEDEVISELGDLIYLNPATEQWETAESYLSGNVYRKLNEAKYACENDKDNHYKQRSLNAIKEIQPDKVPFELLDLNLGERWIPLTYYKNFAGWLFETDIKITYFQSVDTFKAEVVGGYNGKITREFSVSPKSGRRVYGHDLLEYALENTAPFFTYKIGEVKYPDNDAIQLANEKIETIRAKFTEWLYELPDEDKNELTDLYNNTYNCYVLRKYDGKHLLLSDISMEGLKKIGIDHVRDAQKDVAWRIIQDSGAIIDWEVGAGKTLCFVIAAYEMKRMKIRSKPCILCLKANIADVVKTYRSIYPHAKILAPSEQDFEKKNRMRLFHEMKNNDWDCIVMTHDQFGKIPQSNAIQKEIIGDELYNLQRDLDTLDAMGYNISRIMRKGLEIRKATLSAKLSIIKDKIESKQDINIDFESIGIDHLFVDEFHRFKNLTFCTRHNRVAGLGNQTGSQKALNMLFAIRTLQKRFNSDLQATFLSGTPISNSLTEMYLLFKYLRPNELERQNILNFDAWAAVFAKKTTDFEFSVTNQIIAKERFRHFIKVPELALFYNEIADYRTNKSINIDKPDMVEELVPLKPTEDQREFIKNLIEFAKTGDGTLIGREPLTESEDRARMLIATNYAKKMSTDMRLIDSVKYDDHPENKISICARKVADFYREFKDEKSTQLIFCDIGTPKPNAFNVYDAMKQKLIEEYEIPQDEITFIHDWGEKKKFELFKKMNDGIIRVLIGSTDKAGTGLNVQQRIVAMHHLDIPWKPAELEQRSGRGARQGNWLAKLLQDNKVYNFIYAVEQSLDNYKFTLLKNKQTFISQMKTNDLVVRSIDEGSFDEQSGMNFAEYIAVLSGDNSLLEKAKIDKKLAVLESLKNAHYREVHNNKYLLEHKTKRLEEVDEIVIALNRDSELYNSQLTRDEDTGTKDNPIEIFALKDKIIQTEQENAIILKEIAEEKEKKAREREAKKLGLDNEEKEKEIEITEQQDDEKGKENEKESQIEKSDKLKVRDIPIIIGEYLISLHRNWKPIVGEIREKIGQLYGFDLFIERVTNHTEGFSSSGAMYNSDNNLVFSNKFYAQHPHGGLKYVYNQGVPSRENSKIASRNFLNAIDRVDSVLENYTDEQKRLINDITGLKSVQDKGFGKEAEIKELQETSRRLEHEIRVKIQSGKLIEEQVV